MSLVTITGLTAVTITNLTDAAVFEVEDSAVASRKATLAQVRTRLLTTSSATAYSLGPNGTTNPVWQVDCSTGSQAAGLKLTGAATGGTVALLVQDSGSNANLSINAKGSGTIAVGSTSTGTVTLANAVVFTGGAVSGITTLAGTGAVSGFTSWTGTGLIKTTLTTQQLALHFDADNHLAVTVSSAGAVTYNATGASAEHNFPDIVKANAGLTVTGATSTTTTLAMVSGQKFYLDGVAATGDTYIYESAANTLSFRAGGASGFFNFETSEIQRASLDANALTLYVPLCLDNAYVASVQVPTGYIIIKDSNGTSYKVSCNA